MSGLNLADAATPVAFIYVADRERALRFYRDVLGFELRSADAFGDFIALNGALLRMTVMADHKPSPHPVLGWSVADIEALARALLSRGVAFMRFNGMEQDELGVWRAPDGGAKVAFFADPDGNMLSITEMRG